jgi:hypothetical protein
MLISSFHIVPPHGICFVLSHMSMHLHYICRFFHVPYSMLPLSLHIISLCCMLFALIYCVHGKGLVNKCYCQINQK